MEIPNPFLFSTAMAGFLGSVYAVANLSDEVTIQQSAGSKFPSAFWVGNFPRAEVLSKTSQSHNWDYVIVSNVVPNSWAQDTLETIAAHRHLKKGWDGKSAATPSKEALDIAEILTSAFAQVSTNVRPLFAVDVDGNPGFAANESDYYLHLTIDGPNTISWYTVKGGKPSYEDQIQVDSLNSFKIASDILLMA